MNYDAFISYSTKDEQVASQIERALTNAGISCWMATNMSGSGVFEEEIAAVLLSSRSVVCILSNAANESQWVLRELALAQDANIPIFTYMIEKFEMAPVLRLRLTSVPWLDSRTDPIQRQSELIRHVADRLGVTQMPRQGEFILESTGVKTDMITLDIEELPRAAVENATGCVTLGCRRCWEKDPNNAESEDYAWLFAGHDRVMGVLADGISQSFFGQIAAQCVVKGLAKILLEFTSLDDSPGSRKALTDALRLIARQGAKDVMAYPLRPGLSPNLKQLLEEERGKGSQAVFGAFIFDRAARRLVVCQLGDVRVRWFTQNPAGIIMSQLVEANRQGCFSTSTTANPDDEALENDLVLQSFDNVVGVLIHSGGVDDDWGAELAGLDLRQRDAIRNTLNDWAAKDDVSMVSVMTEPLLKGALLHSLGPKHLHALQPTVIAKSPMRPESKPYGDPSNIRPSEPVPTIHHPVSDANGQGQSNAPSPLDENVQFTVYRPQAVRTGIWYDLIAFAHLAERRWDAPKDEPDPVDEVRRQAEQILGSNLAAYRDTTQDSLQAVPREGEITFIPIVDGVAFNPPRRSFLWQESVHREEFRFRVFPVVEEQTVRGRMQVFLGSILLAELPLAIRVSAAAAPVTIRHESNSARPFRRIFASYSHRDTHIVQQFEAHAKALGDRYFRDVIDLRSGEVWGDRVEAMIRESDLFQLFWSTNSMRSRYVRSEWEYALSLGRPDFVRPTYWEDPLPEVPDADLPPEPLRRLHFQHIGFVAANHTSNETRDIQPVSISSDLLGSISKSIPNTAYLPGDLPQLTTPNFSLSPPPETTPVSRGSASPFRLPIVLIAAIVVFAVALLLALFWGKHPSH